MRKTVAVDCDEVLVNSGEYWFRYLARKFSYNNVLYDPKNKPYNLTEMFDTPEDYNTHEFWEKSGIYDNMEPNKDAVSCVEELSEHFDIICVSKIMGNHAESKRRFIQKHFPAIYSIIFTEDKHLVKFDYLLDDRCQYSRALVPCKEWEFIHMESNYEDADKEDLKELNVSINTLNWDRAVAYIKTVEGLYKNKLTK